MKQSVDIQGAGELSTKIAFNDGDIVVSGASNAELRFLTVENSRPGGGGPGTRYAIYNSGASPSLLHVTAIAVGGYSYGVLNTDVSSPKLNNIAITISGGAGIGVSVYQASTTTTIQNSSISVSGGGTGVSLHESNAKIQNSNIIVSGGTGGYAVLTTANVGSYSVNV